MKSIDQSISAKKTAPKKKKVNLPVKLTPDLSDDPEKSLLAGIDAMLEGELKPKFRKQEAFSPSNTNLCARYAHYLFEGIELPVTHDARVQRIFDSGNAIHERLCNYFKKMGILIDEEKRVEYRKEGDPPFNAYVDAIIDWNGPKVVELKSISAEGFMYRKLSQKPKDDHMRQIQLYFQMLDYQAGYIIYYNKNTSEILVLYIKRDQEFIDKTLKKIRKTYKAIQEGIKPVRPYKSIESEQCRYCNVRDHCWKEDKDVGEKI